MRGGVPPPHEPGNLPLHDFFGHRRFSSLQHNPRQKLPDGTTGSRTIRENH
jgi:hypothetical protein